MREAQQELVDAQNTLSKEILERLFQLYLKLLNILE